MPEAVLRPCLTWSLRRLENLSMRTLLCVPLVLALLTPNCQAQQKSSSPDNRSIDARIDREIGPLLETYKMLHAAPELSHHEDKTSTFFAAELRKLEFTV